MFRSKSARAERAAREAAEPLYEIFDLDTKTVLQEVTGTAKAQRQHQVWAAMWLSSNGPRTALRMKPTGVPAAKDTLDALIINVIPGQRRKAYRRALELIIIQQVPLEELLWLANGGERG